MTLERPMGKAEAPEPPRADPESPAVAAVGMVLCGLAALLAGLVEVVLTPLYVGRWLFPVTLLLAIVTNVALPLLARQFIDATVAATIPVVLWLLTVLVLACPARRAMCCCRGEAAPSSGCPTGWSWSAERRVRSRLR